MSIARLMQMARAGVFAESVWIDPNLSNVSYDGVSFSVAGQDNTPRGIFFNPSGLGLYVLGGVGDDINQYSLSTPWDISSASYVRNFSVFTQDSNPWGLSFKTDGTKMYVVGDTNDRIFEYNLGTAWDISTASYVQSFSVGAQAPLAIGLSFKPDGSKLFFLDFINNQVEEYSLSTPWDISTATHTRVFLVSAQASQPIAIFFSPTGDSFFVSDNLTDSVVKYSMSSAWNISTASYSQKFVVTAQESNPAGLFFKSDGSRMYVSGSTTDAIYQYSIV